VCGLCNLSTTFTERLTCALLPSLNPAHKHTQTRTYTHSWLVENKGISLSLTHPMKSVWVCVCVCVCVVRWGWRNRIIEDQLSCWQTVFIQEGVSRLSLYLSYTHTRASVSRALQPSIREGCVSGVCEHVCVCVCVCVLMDSLKWVHETKKKKKERNTERERKREHTTKEKSFKMNNVSGGISRMCVDFLLRRVWWTFNFDLLLAWSLDPWMIVHMQSSITFKNTPHYFFCETLLKFKLI